MPLRLSLTPTRRTASSVIPRLRNCTSMDRPLGPMNTMRRGMPSCFWTGISQSTSWMAVRATPQQEVSMQMPCVFSEKAIVRPSSMLTFNNCPVVTFQCYGLVVTQEGEGPFVANTDDILYFGDGLGETGPSYQNNPIYTHPRVQEIRHTSVNPTTPLGQGDYKVTGVVDPTSNNPSQGHFDSPYGFCRLGTRPDGRVTWVFRLWIFNTTLSEIVVQNPDSATPFPPK